MKVRKFHLCYYQRGIKCLEINLKNIYSENCDILLKEIKEDLSKWKDIPAHELESQYC